MKALIGFGALGVCSLGPILLWAIVRHARRQPDRQWKATGYRYLHTGHDESLQRRAAKRASETAVRRTAMASERSKPLAAPPAIAGGAKMVDIRRVRATG
jgi:hypothetical protein